MRNLSRVVRSGFALVLAAGLASATNAQVIFGTSTGYGVSVDLELVGVTQFFVPPQAMATGVAPPAYNEDAFLASLSASNTLLGEVSTGALFGTAVSNVDSGAGARFANASGTVDDLVAGFLPLGPDEWVLELSATSIEATAIVSGTFGGLVAEGNTVITDGMIFFLGAPLNFNSEPDPNTVILDVAGLTITLNHQVMSGDGIEDRSIGVNAIHIAFDEFAFGGGLVSGEVIFGHADAALIAIPAPASAVLLGLAAIGLPRRRRRDQDGQDGQEG